MSSLSALMEFLRLLCENHYREMQDYMRTQPDNLRSYNMVGNRVDIFIVAKSHVACFFVSRTDIFFRHVLHGNKS